jgi:flavodoxin
MFPGFVQIPVSTDNKKSLIPWKDIKETPDLSKFGLEFRRAAITGKINNIIVVDVDKPKPNKDEKDGLKYFKQLMKNNPETLTFITKSGGRHYYFKYDDDIDTKNIGVNGYSIDVLSNNNYAIMYEVLYDNHIQTMPSNVKEFIMSWRNRKTKAVKTTQPKEISENIEFKYDLDEVVKVLNKLPAKYYNDFKSWMSVTSALKSANLKEQWESFSKKSDKYDETNNESIWTGLTPNVDLTFLTVLMKCEGIQSKLKVHRWCSKLELFTTTPNETRDEKYLNLDNFDFDEHSNILIKSATGTGKTTCTAKLIKKIRQGHGYKVLSIVSRVSLAQQHQKNFDNMVSYQDIKTNEYSDCKDLVIQLDSIIHLDPKKLRNTIVYLDEINSMFDYLLNSSTLKNRRLQVYNMLCVIIKCASYVIGVDADLSDIVMKFFKFFEIDPYVIHNKYQNAKGKVTQYLSSDKLIADMKAKLKRGEKFVCCFDSLRYQDEVVQELKGYCERNKLSKDDFLIYSSKDGDDQDLKDATTTWKDKYVFYTPKIVYGVDFVPDAELCVYAFFKCTSVSPLSFSQMVSRCRTIKHLRYFIQERNTSLMYLSADKIKDNYDEISKYYDEVVDILDPINKDRTPTKSEVRFIEYDQRTDEVVISTSIFDEMYWQQQYYNSIMRSAMNHHFKAILQEKGYKIDVNETEAMHKIDTKKLKEEVKSNNIEVVERVINDPDDSLTAGEKKIKSSMEKRAGILHIEVDDDTYRDELVDDNHFTTHMNVCSLLNINNDPKFVSKIYKDMKVQNMTSNTTKLKLISEVQTIMNVSPLCIDDIQEGVIPDDKIEIIKKVFRINKVNLISMYRNLVPGIMTSRQIMTDGVRERVYEINRDTLKHHLDLLCHRNHKMSGIDANTLTYYGYKQPEVKRML